MNKTLNFRQPERRPPYELCRLRYINPDGLEIINVVGEEASRLYEEHRARARITSLSSGFVPGRVQLKAQQRAQR